MKLSLVINDGFDLCRISLKTGFLCGAETIQVQISVLAAYSFLLLEGFFFSLGFIYYKTGNRVVCGLK